MKKPIAILLLIAVILDCNSCFMYRTIGTQADIERYAGNNRIDVLRVYTKHDGMIPFNPEVPAKMNDSAVTGQPARMWNYGDTDSLEFKRKQALAIWKGGIRYPLVSQDSTGFLTVMQDMTAIPYSEIDSLFFKKYQPHKTGLVVVAAQAVVVGIFIILLFTWEPLTDAFSFD